jgi:outer membrane receptor protein involved in Fe transport
MRLSWRISGHYDEVKDQILFVTQSPLAAQRRNVGRTRTYGGELDVMFRPLDGVSLNLGYANAESAIKDFPGNSSRVGKRVPNVSRHQVVMGLTVGYPDRIQATLLGRYLSRQFADDLNTQPIADFVVLDASLHRNGSCRA